MEKSKGQMKSRLSYAAGAFGNDVFYATLSTYFIMFVTTHLFNTGDPKQNSHYVLLITNIISILRILEVFIDPLIGNMIDNTNTKYGKFKPWVVGGGIISSITLLLLFTDLGGLNKTNPFLYLVLFGIIYLVMDVFYSIKDIGFWSMIPALSLDSHEREKMATFARIGSTIGANIVGVAIMPIVLFFSMTNNSGSGDKSGWFWFAFIVALIGVITSIAVGIGTREVESKIRDNNEKTSLKQVFKVLGQNDQLMWFSLGYWFYGLGINTLNALQLYYFTFILGDSGKYSILYGLNTVVGLVSVSLFPTLADKFNRKRLFYGCIAVMLGGIGIFSIAGTSLPIILTAAELFFIPQPLVFLVVFMIISDSVEYGQWKTGHRDESLTLSVRPLIDKLGGAMSNWLVSTFAVAAGMTTGASASTITTHQQFIFKLGMFAFPAATMLIGAFIVARKITLTEARHAKIVEELEHRFSVATSENEVKANVVSLVTPTTGYLVDLSSVNDEHFASGSMGKGFAIKPTDGAVFAPISGTIRQILPTRHAVGIESEDGVIVLIHVGIGTVKLNGEGFISYVEQGDRVEVGQKLLEFWSPIIEKNGLDDTVLVTVTNSEKFSAFHLEQKVGEKVEALSEVITFKKGE
ncbi:PTS sugar transporter subunit IIA [Streptococcus thermophilus]|uniref:PTS sugar transporter subunit IIA n=1 Tax=Streptococcus thermophilus TaxID=1308 RepID=UPI0022FDD770|nr:PTS sugar transporter subunit IIA [Streptococcus thermophilus]MDA5538940.1 PTS sugar transporter subunit IIA [Streptococcus thermophilus]WCL60112.1 PTS sugar transporter subunit IIA [Streptococcus thermophilus]